MAKKKTTTVTTEEELPQDQYNYKEDHDKSMAAVATEKFIDEKEEEPVVEKKEPVKEPAKEEEIEFNPEQLKAEAAEEAANKILERFTGVKEKKDEKDQELVSPWAKEGRNPKDYEEIADWAVAKKAILDERSYKEYQELTTKEQAAKQKATEEQEKSFLAFVGSELNELYSLKELPTIKDTNDPKDPGVVATNELLQAMATVNADRASKGEPLIYSINKIYHHFYKPSNRQPAGADAPVSMGSRNSRQSDSDDSKFVYARDHKKSFRQLSGE